VSGGWLDGDFYGHPKVVHAWSLHHSSIGIWALAVSHAHKWATGGFVSRAFVAEKLPSKRERERVIQALTSIAPSEQNPLWSDAEGGWMIHNFGKRASFRDQESEEELRRKRSEAGRLGGLAKHGKTSSNLPDNLPDVAISKTPGKPLAQRKALTTAIERPELLSLCQMLASGVLLNDPKAKPNPESKGWLDAARLLIDLDGRPGEEVERVIAWSQADSFWRPNIQSMPKLRDKYSQLLLRMNGSEGAARRESPSDLLRAMEATT
jgi:hypothetical protein